MKKRPFLLFDFDGTLADTSKQEPYRRTSHGRDYLSANPACVETYYFGVSEGNKTIAEICEEFYNAGRIAIITDAPENVIRPQLTRHYLNQNIRILGSASKPSTDKFQLLQYYTKVDPNEMLVIGDSPKDILFAHAIGAASVGVTWQYLYNDSHRKKLRKMLTSAQPNKIIDHPDELLDTIIEFSEEEFEYKRRKIPEVYLQLDDIAEIEDTEVNYLSLGLHGGEHRGCILDFKAAKDFCIDDIKKNGLRNNYFYNGSVRYGRKFIDVIESFQNDVKEKIAGLNLCGTSKIIATPNSCPHWCYKTDVNQYFIRHLDLDYVWRKNGIVRLYPKEEAHIGSRTSFDRHIETMGFHNELDDVLNDTDNLIVFDDVRTHSVQTKAVASCLRSIGYGGNIYVVTLSHVMEQASDVFNSFDIL